MVSIQRKIIHVDMDCFFAAVEILERPELKGRPVAVGGSPEGRGVIATSNYEARKYGVRSAMASSRAMKLCPSLVLLRPQFSKYKAASLKVREVFYLYTDLVEPLSLDEAYLDVTACAQFGGSATLIARDIRKKIFEATGLTASAGVAPNKFLAKVACEENKPNGQFTIAPDKAQEFVRQLPIEKIFGVGKVTAKKMHSKGYYTCADLEKIDLPKMIREFGSWGPGLYQLCRGNDERPVSNDHERKSISVENTFGQDLTDLNRMKKEIEPLFEDLMNRWRRQKLEFSMVKTCFLKLKFSDFKQRTKECQVRSQEASPEVFNELLIELWEKWQQPVRLIGVGFRLKSEPETSANTSQLNFFE